jgi:D-alanyl-D-alanine carboxypeptidase
MTADPCPEKIRFRPRMLKRAHHLLVGLVIGLCAISAAPAIAASGFSAVAVDAHSGKVLFAQNADAPRYPASLTKVMTLYILFEELKAKRLKLSSPLKCSLHSASRPPSKLGLRAGESVAVEDAIKALVTRSANDVAATIAENISGSERAFAVRMTNTARALGMTRTLFRNASGLPDPQQVTTARDMATLGLRIQRDFPEYYHYFRISSFTYKGRVVRTHNRLIGRYAGADGIKTGYIRASGYNLTASAARKGKRLLGVVMGGKSGASRNAYMVKMLDKYFSKARASRVNTIAAVAGTPPGWAGTTHTASVEASEKAPSPPMPKSKPGSSPQAVSVAEAVGKPESSNRNGENGSGSEKPPQTGATAAERPAPDGKEKASSTQVLATDSLFKIAAAAAAEAPESMKAEAKAEADAINKAKPGWQIQIGAYPTKDGAMRIIEKALSMDLNPLAGKTAFAIPITRGSSTLYRARFSGFDRSTAREACKELERKGFGCLPLAPQG